MAAPKTAEKIHISARAITDYDVSITPETLRTYVVDYLSDEGLYEDFAMYILANEMGLDKDDLEIRDADIVW